MDNIQQEIIYCGRNEKINIKEEILSTQLEERLKQEEILWKKKYKVNLVRGRIKKCHFFHNSMLQHMKHYKIVMLKAGNGRSIQQHREIAIAIKYYFNNLLAEPQQDIENTIGDISINIPRLLSE